MTMCPPPSILSRQESDESGSEVVWGQGMETEPSVPAYPEEEAAEEAGVTVRS